MSGTGERLRCLIRTQSSSRREGLRSVHVGVHEPRSEDEAVIQQQLKFSGNYVSTTKYNIFSYIPKALFEQYRRFANIYFTLVAALSLTAYSPIRPLTAWLPLIFVVGISIVKEGIEDWKRYQADVAVNNRQVEVLNPATAAYESKPWRKLRAGDIVVVCRDQSIPADLLLLTAENSHGTCHVETTNLDGETNLKVKRAPDETQHHTRHSLLRFSGRVEFEAPNAQLYQFAGNLVLRPAHSQGFQHATKVPLSVASLLLRGSVLRNTPRVYGAVIYAGPDTKIMKNSSLPPSKRSRVERGLDLVMLAMFVFLLAFCLTGSCYYAYWTTTYFVDHWYLAPGSISSQYDPNDAGSDGVTSFMTSFILYGFLIPITMYISMEAVKVVQSLVFIEQDRDMYHAESGMRALARTSNLVEELGMVTTILSDKTGTLTRNTMEFFKCSIAGMVYGSGSTEVERSNASRRGVEIPDLVDPAAKQYQQQFFNFYDRRMMDGAWLLQPNAGVIELFLRCLALCHTVLPADPPEGVEQSPDSIRYEAESPDEAALVVAGKALGCMFWQRDGSIAVTRELTPGGEQQQCEYHVLNVIEFTSARKRMSVVVRDQQGRIFIFSKGAESVIAERLDPNHPLNVRYRDITLQHTEEFGAAGLRTLCVAYNELDHEMYDRWQAEYMLARTSLEDHAARVNELNSLVETNLRLLGCTAIEDKLQDGVSRSIRQLSAANIRIWVLTGDKTATAINICYACNLLADDMIQIKITLAMSDQGGTSPATGVPMSTSSSAPGDGPSGGPAAFLEPAAVVERQLREAAQLLAAATRPARFALIIDGMALSHALSSRLVPLLLDVGMRCAAVICCRVTPLQKALVAEVVRLHGDTVLAIGDGANDVGMIQQAHIGIGISGQEGMQAVMASDFAIAQFRFLVPLLLVHGRWAYRRVTRMINFFMFKNLVYGITIYVYNAAALFSGQSLYQDVFIAVYSPIFTLLTPLVLGMFDRDVSKNVVLSHPRLYIPGQRNEGFNMRVFTLWFVNALYQCTMLMIMVLLGCSATGAARASGHPFTLWEEGVVAYTIILLAVHLQAARIIEQWTCLHHFAIWFTLVFWVIFLCAYGAIDLGISQAVYYLFMDVVAPGPQFWLMLLLVPVACGLPDLFIRSVSRLLRPEDSELLQEMESKGGMLDSSQLPPDPFLTASADVELAGVARLKAAVGNGSASGPGLQDGRQMSNAALLPPGSERSNGIRSFPVTSEPELSADSVDSSGLGDGEHVDADQAESSRAMRVRAKILESMATPLIEPMHFGMSAAPH